MRLTVKIVLCSVNEIDTEINQREYFRDVGRRFMASDSLYSIEPFVSNEAYEKLKTCGPFLYESSFLLVTLLINFRSRLEKQIKDLLQDDSATAKSILSLRFHIDGSTIFPFPSKFFSV